MIFAWNLICLGLPEPKIRRNDFGLELNLPEFDQQDTLSSRKEGLVMCGAGGQVKFKAKIIFAKLHIWSRRSSQNRAQNASSFDVGDFLEF